MYFLTFVTKDVASVAYIHKITFTTFVLVEFITISLLFYYLINSQKFKRLILTLIFLYTVSYILYDNIGVKSIGYNLGVVTSFLLLICFIFYFFYEKIRTVVLHPLYQTSSFWIAVGLFIYFSGNFFVVIFSQTSNPSPDFVIQLRWIVLVVTLLKNIFLSIALFVREPIIENDSGALEIPDSLDLDEFDPNNFKNDRE